MGYTLPAITPRILTLHSLFCHTFRPDYRFHGEEHDFYELVCVLEGQVYVTADNRIFTLEKGQAILHPPMQFHNIGSYGGSTPTVLVVSFSGDHIPPLENRLCRINDLSRAKSLYELGRRALTLENALWVIGGEEESYRPLRFAKELELFLLQLADHSDTRTSLASRQAAAYTTIVNAIEDTLSQRLSVTALAARCRMSPVSLQKNFTRYAGVGVAEYATRRRIHAAAHLLEQGASVKEAAAAVGYSDQNYFSTVFKRTVGCAPSKWHK